MIIGLEEPGNDLERRNWKMKKLIALLLGLALLCGCAAAFAEGEELPYLETIPNDNYYGGVTTLTDASYPQVCISPFNAYELFARNSKEPMYVTFPCPEGVDCSGFAVDSSDFAIMDVDNCSREYYYQATTSYSYEVFLSKVEDEANILMDGSDGVAAYIKPDGDRAYALFGLDEIEKSAKLYVQIHLVNLRGMEDAEKADALKTAITEEIARLQGSMAIVKLDQFWTDGTYKGVNLYIKNAPGEHLKMDLPEMTFHFDGEDFGGKPFVTSLSKSSFNAHVAVNREKIVNIDAAVDYYSYVYYNRDESEITKATLSDGNEWGIYVANERDGKPYSVHAARVLYTVDNNGEAQPYYLTIQMDCASSGMYWADVNAFIQDLDQLAVAVQAAE